MNRLQVGDECYVRAEGVIYKCKYKGSGYGTAHFAMIINRPGYYFDLRKSSGVKLVYPFPCVKDLAI